MPKKDFQDYICRPFCDYFKPGVKEELLCRGAVVVEQLVRQQRLNPENFAALNRNDSLTPGQAAELEAVVCKKCLFKTEDCDYQSPDPPADCRPCGGLILLKQLTAGGLVAIPECTDVDHGFE